MCCIHIKYIIIIGLLIYLRNIIYLPTNYLLFRGCSALWSETLSWSYITASVHVSTSNLSPVMDTKLSATSPPHNTYPPPCTQPCNPITLPGHHNYPKNLGLWWHHVTKTHARPARREARLFQNGSRAQKQNFGKPHTFCLVWRMRKQKTQ